MLRRITDSGRHSEMFQPTSDVAIKLFKKRRNSFVSFNDGALKIRLTQTSMNHLSFPNFLPLAHAVLQLAARAVHMILKFRTSTGGDIGGSNDAE